MKATFQIYFIKTSAETWGGGGRREKEKKNPNKQSKEKMKAKTTPYAGEKGDNQKIQESQKLNIKT